MSASDSSSLRTRLFGSLHARLFWALCATAIPVLAGLVFYVLQQRNVLSESNRRSVYSVAEVAALYESAVFSDSQDVLLTLALAPVIQQRDWPVCSRYLSALLEAHSRFANFGVIGADGNVLCSGIPLLTEAQGFLGDRSYFQRALQQPGVIIGDYQQGRITGAPTLVLATRLAELAGVEGAVLFVSLDLGSLRPPVLRQAQLQGSRFAIFDRSGFVLQSVSGDRYPVGQQVDLSRYHAVLQGSRSGALELHDANGQGWYQVVFLVGPESDPQSITMLYEVPLSGVFQEANRAFMVGLLVVLFLVAMAVAAGWSLTQAAIGRNVLLLGRAVRRLAARDYSQNVAGELGGREFVEIGQQFDDMARQVQRHERRLEAVALRHAGQNQVLRLIAQGHRLNVILEALCRFLQEQFPDAATGLLVFKRHSLEISLIVGVDLPPPYRACLERHGARALPLNPESRRPAWLEPVFSGQITGTEPAVQALAHAREDAGFPGFWAVPVCDGEGLALGVLQVLRPVSGEPDDDAGLLLQLAAELAAVAIERDRIKDSLRQSEREYRAFFERNPNPMLVFDQASGDMLAVNDRAILHYGYTRPEFLTHRVRDLAVNPADWPRDIAAQRSVTLEQRRQDGSTLLARIALQPLEVTGRIAQLAIIEDITEREALARSVRERDALVSMLMDVTSEAICGLDAEGRFHFANQACLRLLGYSAPESLIGQPFSEIVGSAQSPSDVAAIERLLDALRSGRDVHEDDVWFRGREGERFPVECWGYPVRRDGRLDGSLITFLDISERRRQQQALEYQATHDALTGLLNRSLLLPRIEAAIQGHRQGGVAGLAVMVLDLDGFKEINDALGHSAGDLLLQQMGARLGGAMQESDTLIRLGGDEFAVIRCADPAPDALSQFARDLLQTVRQPVQLDQLQVRINASLGIARFPHDAQDAQTLVRHADIAMYKAKREGLGLGFFDQAEGEAVANRLRLSADLRRAVSQGDFTLYYQPKTSLHANGVPGVEVLARWVHPDRGMIPPSDFIPIIEVSDLIHPFTAWVLQQAVRVAAAWHAQGIVSSVAVNLSARNLLDTGFPGQLHQLLEAEGLPPSMLELELTESSIMADPEGSRDVLMQLHAMGVKIAIDDFGTGYSSLAYLQRLPVDSVKIDKSFIQPMLDDPDALAIVSSIIELAHTLDIAVVAEGVETAACLERLQVLRCDQAQGYFIARPMPQAQAQSWLMTHRMS